MIEDHNAQRHSEAAKDNPREREQQFLAERLAPLRPKGGEGPAGAQPAPDITRPAEVSEQRLPREFRRSLVE